MLEIGDPAPSFALPNQNDETVRLEDYAGRRLVVYFYPRADTPGCTTEACDFRDTWKEFTKRDVAVVGISDDPVPDLATFSGKYELPFDLLSDEDGSVSASYGSYGEKNMFGRTFDGVFRNTFVVDGNGEIEAVFEKVSPNGHAEELLASLG